MAEHDYCEGEDYVAGEGPLVLDDRVLELDRRYKEVLAIVDPDERLAAAMALTAEMADG